MALESNRASEDNEDKVIGSNAGCLLALSTNPVVLKSLFFHTARLIKVSSIKDYSLFQI